LYGSWERESLKIWTFLCREAKYVYDVGANTGVYSLIAKTVNTSSNVYAFEPVIRVYDRLKSNILLNKFDIKSYCIGLSNHDGFADIYDPGGEHLYSVTINKNLLPETKCVKKTQIPISRFDSWFIQNGINGLDLMKIDVETHEPEVISGMGQLLVKYRPTMIIEVLNETVGDQINSLIDGLGYEVYSIDESHGTKKVQTITKSPSFNYLLCQPSIEQELITNGVLRS
jgi:FkbM family methyltransferase